MFKFFKKNEYQLPTGPCFIGTRYPDGYTIAFRIREVGSTYVIDRWDMSDKWRPRYDTQQTEAEALACLEAHLEAWERGNPLAGKILSYPDHPRFIK